MQAGRVRWFRGGPNDFLCPKPSEVLPNRALGIGEPNHHGVQVTVTLGYLLREAGVLQEEGGNKRLLQWHGAIHYAGRQRQEVGRSDQVHQCPGAGLVNAPKGRQAEDKITQGTAAHNQEAIHHLSANKSERVPRLIPRSFNARSTSDLSLIHISEPTRLGMISYAV